MIILRPYQEKAVQIGVDYFRGPSTEPSIIVAPTAYGKSVVISTIANQLTGRTLVLQPSKELLEQNFNKLMQMGGMASIYSASMGEKEFGQITYATIGSIKNIGAKFKALGYTNVIVDECHLYPPSADSMFGTFINDLGHRKVLGFTATPFRLQTNTSITGYRFSQLVMLTSRSKNAGFFKKILHVHQIGEMVKDKYWSPLEYEVYDSDTGRLTMNSTGAEFTDESVMKFYEEANLNQRIARRARDVPHKSILIFVPMVSIAHELQAMIPDSVVVYGDMDKHTRDYSIKAFKAGRYRVAINVNVLSVGFDYPGIDCVIMGRPTASLAWYYQALGRGTRIKEGKDRCTVIDFVGNVSRFGGIEGLTIEHDGNRWEVWSGDIQLTSIPVSEIGTVMRGEKHGYRMPFGKHKGKSIDEVPITYLNWMLKEVTWSERNTELKDQIKQRIKRVSDGLGANARTVKYH